MIFRDNPGATNGQLLPVLSYRLHDEFNLAAPGVPNDFAIIYLTIPADTSVDHVKNAVLPPNNNNLFVHCNCYAVGWGRVLDADVAFSNTLQWVQMCGIQNNDCAGRVAGVDHARIYAEHFCLLSDPPGRGPCNGDVGSPIFCNPNSADTSVMYAVGIVSWNAGASGRCNLQFPVVNTRISDYLPWLDIYAPPV